MWALEAISCVWTADRVLKHRRLSYYLTWLWSIFEQGSEGEWRARRLVVVCISDPQSVSCCQSAPTVLCTGSWPIAVAGWTGLGRTEHRATSVSDRDSDSSLSLAAWSSTFRRNVVLPFSKAKRREKTSKKN